MGEVYRPKDTARINDTIVPQRERTVERHLSNIFNKLDLTSRSAASADAYEHQLL